MTCFPLSIHLISDNAGIFRFNGNSKFVDIHGNIMLTFLFTSVGGFHLVDTTGYRLKSGENIVL
jgi:hypothetical protein